MSLIRKKALILCTALIATAIMATGWFAWAKNISLRPEADLKTAADLSALSGLPGETVLRLYDAAGKWDSVRENIFVYKRVLKIAGKDKAVFNKVFDLAGQYKATDILTVFEYLGKKGKPLQNAAKLLEQHAVGASMEAVLAGAEHKDTNKVYRPADENQVRHWLGQGYVPQDILNADTIAREKDLRIADVLALKAGSGSWEQAGKKLGYTFDKPKSAVVAITVDGSSGTATFTGKDYATAVKQGNGKAEKERFTT
jgi:hypothetical protein